MKRIFHKVICVFWGVLLCVSLSGCTIGEYSVFDFYLDENGNQRFMLFGKHGANGDEEEIENESSEIVDNMQESENSENVGNDIQDNDDSVNSIIGTSLKRGWTSSDNFILKGRDVAVKEDSILFSINLGQEKEITISYDILLDDGEYQLVYVGPDGTEQILQDSKIIQSEEKILFTQGQNEIAILSKNAVFKDIDITITGIEVSDFK